MTKKILFLFFTAILFVSCSNEDSCLSVEKSLVSVEPMSATRSNISDVDLYRVKYKDIVLDNVKLSQSDLNLLKSARSIDTVSVDVHGVSGWDKWDTGRSQPYRRGFSADDATARLCGIPAGTYFVNDVYLHQTYTLPTSMAIILNDKSEYPSNTTNIGWNPDNLKVRGYKASLSGSTVTMQTAAYKVDYEISGQQTFRTYPVNYSNVIWKLKYIQVSM